jgi:hypothetical protein
VIRSGHDDFSSVLTIVHDYGQRTLNANQKLFERVVGMLVADLLARYLADQKIRFRNKRQIVRVLGEGEVAPQILHEGQFVNLHALDMYFP